jgi:filamentous hemagglutinin family protein
MIRRPLPTDRNKRPTGGPVRAGVSTFARLAARCRPLSATALVLCAGLPPFGAPARAGGVLPTGASVASGSAAIGAPAGNALSVTQTSARAIINWGSFSIGQANSVTFNQPGASSAVLNRVTGSTTSTIAGQLNANGQVYLVNPNGISITPSGAVRVGGGFVASTLAISNDDFNAGNLNFTGNGASAAVSNAGSIVAGPGGFVGLLGGSASNSGTIVVPLGKVGLGSGEQATLDLTGDGFLQVAVPANAKTADGQALVDVSGKIRAAGGSVQLEAATVASAIRDAVNVSGFVSASSAHASGGSIVLGGGPGGNVSVTGRLVASGRSTGGRIRIAGANVSLRNARIAAQSRAGQGGTVTVKAGAAATLGASTIDVSGASGGGTVRIGGAQTQSVSIDSATTIKADATAKGNGGAIIIRSGGQTAVHGSLTAIGGPLGGDGGQIETSGKTVDFAGLSVNASAALGKAGTWLLDPTDLIIDATLASEIDGILNTGVSGTNVTLQTSATGAPTGATLTSGETNSSGSGDIIDNAALGWSTSATLTLSAYHSIAINAPITISGAGGLVLTTNNNVGGASSDGTYSFAPGQSVSFTGVYTSVNDGGNSALDGAARGALNINGTSFTLINSMAQFDAIDGVSAVNGSVVAQYGPGLGGAYALVSNLTASASYTSALIGLGPSTPFSGVLEGLGNTITGLTINAPATTYVGLIGMSTGTARDIGLVGGSIAGGDYVGALVGWNHGGMVMQAYATATVTAPNGNSGEGGLVGVNDMNGAIVESYATGAVTGQTTVGGLVGYNSGTITQAYATGAVTGQDYVGGLVGANQVDVDNNGNPISSGDISQAYATGPVRASLGQSGGAGGLVGVNAGTINQTYATGAVSGDGAENLGGLVGANYGAVTNSYYDVLTTGLTSDGGGATGLTTAQLQNGGLASLGFDSTVWGGGTSGLYPYLTNFFPNGVQAVSGIAYADRGVTPLASPSGVIAGAGAPNTVSAMIGGQSLGQATTGANGYYYFVAPAGTISASGSAVLAYTTAASSGPNAQNAGILISTASPLVQNFDIWGNTLIAPTNRTSLSDVLASGITSGATLLADNGSADQTLLNIATGSNTGVAAVMAGLANAGYIATASAGFTVDAAVPANGLYVQTTDPNGSIAVTAAQTIAGATALSLLSSNALTFAQPVTMTGNGIVDLTAAYDTTTVPGQSLLEMSFAPGVALSFTGTNSDGTPQGGLTINSTPYTLVNSMAELDAIDGVSAVDGSTIAQYGAGLGGAYALATGLAATATYASALIASGDSNGNSPATPFSGVLEGLGHTVSNLTIAAPGASYIGLIGWTTGTVRDIGLVGGVVSGGAEIGALVGENDGAIENAYESGAVVGTVGGANVVAGLAAINFGAIVNAYASGDVSGPGEGNGGLVGYNYGTITRAYATGAVSAGGGAGGFVGENQGTIEQAYATGAVSSEGYFVGGFVGVNIGVIANAYATGAVSAFVGGTAPLSGGDAGGFVGGNYAGTITNAYSTGAVSAGAGALYPIGGFAGKNLALVTNAYFDILTSGLTSDGFQGTAIGLTTAQLQGTTTVSLGAAFAGGAAGGQAGVYPYLTAFFPNGVQAIAGFAYADRGTNPLGSPSGFVPTPVPAPDVVSILINGAGVGNATTGANGYYYYFAAAGAIPMTAAQILVTESGSSNGAPVAGATLAENGAANPVLSSLDIYGNYLRLQTSPGETSLTATIANLNIAAGDGAQPASAKALALLNGLTNLEVDATGANFDFDTAAPLANVPLGGSLDTLVVNSAGAVTQTRAIQASNLLLLGGGSFDFADSANQVGTLAASAPGGAIALTTANALTIGVVEGVDGVTTGSLLADAFGNLTLAQAASVTGSGNALTLVSSTGNFVNDAGVGGLSAPNGRWLVYSQNPLQDSPGGLVPAFEQYDTAFNGSFSNILGNGDGFIYASPSSAVTPASLAGTLQAFAVPPSVFAFYDQLYLEYLASNWTVGLADCAPNAIAKAFDKFGHVALTGAGALCD